MPPGVIDHIAIGIAHGKGNGAGVADTFQQLKGQRLPGGGCAPVHGDDFLGGLKPGQIGNGTGRHRADHRRITALAGDEQRPVGHDSEQKISARAGGHDRDPRQHRLAIEGPVALRFRDGALAPVEHLDVPAQGHGGNDVLRAQGIAPAQQRLAETDGKTQHLDATATRDPEVPVFVYRHQHPEREQGNAERIQQIHY